MLLVLCVCSKLINLNFSFMAPFLALNYFQSKKIFFFGQKRASQNTSLKFLIRTLTQTYVHTPTEPPLLLQLNANIKFWRL